MSLTKKLANKLQKRPQNKNSKKCTLEILPKLVSWGGSRILVYSFRLYDVEFVYKFC